MSKRTFIVIAIVGLLIIIAGAIFLLRSGQEPPQEEAQPQDLVTVSPPTEIGGWRLVRHPVFGITFKLPSAWEITIFDKGKGRIEAYLAVEGASAVVSVNQGDDSVRFNREQFSVGNQKPETFTINRGDIRGSGFTTKQRAGDRPALVEDSYLLVNEYSVGDKTLVIFCNVAGSNYRTLIPTCEEIVESLQFIQ